MSLFASFSKSFALPALILAVCSFSVGGANAELPQKITRTWKSADGRPLKADLLEFSETEIKIKRATDFQIVKIPLTALSTDDQTFVKGLVHERNRDLGLTKGPYAEHITGAFEKLTSKEGLNYQLFGSTKWDGKKRYPLVITLHGSGQSGSDNQAQMGGVTKIFTDAEHQSKNPCFMIAPQCPDSAIGWSKQVADQLIVLIDDLTAKLPIDVNRLYLTGYSMGGFGCFSLAAKYPGKFAAVIPLAGGGDPKKADVLKQTPIWAFHGDQDDQVGVERTRNVMQAISGAGGTLGKYDELQGQGHGIPGMVYSRADLHEWIFAQKRDAAKPETVK